MADIRYNKEQMISTLQENVCSVMFEKKNNSVRQMHCTLNPEFAPWILRTKGKGAPRHEGVIAVWDIEERGWRSFRVKSVLQFDVLEEISEGLKKIPEQIVKATRGKDFNDAEETQEETKDV